MFSPVIVHVIKYTRILRSQVFRQRKLEYSLRLLVKRNDWLLADTCPQAANHCALFWVWEWTQALKPRGQVFRQRKLEKCFQRGKWHQPVHSVAINPKRNDNRCKLFRSRPHRAHKKYSHQRRHHSMPYSTLSVWCHYVCVPVFSDFACLQGCWITKLQFFRIAHMSDIIAKCVAIY